MVLGILVLSFTMDLLFNNSFGRNLSLINAVIGWSISLFFSTFYWLVTRGVLIQFRQLFPKLKDSFKRISLFTIVCISSLFLVNYVGTLILSQAIGVNFDPKSDFEYVLPIIFVSLMTMAIYEAIYFYIKLRQSIREEEQAKQAIVQAQLDALRNQAQPHFFFNTLNTLRDIIDQNTKEEAKEFVDKISDVYRFILESGNANLIEVKDEIKFAKSYIHIQSERFGSGLQVEWNIPEEKLTRAIVPMSLQILLENAIKHNIVSPSNPLKIKVNIIDDKLQVINKIKPKSTMVPSTKMGISNIKKRYALITEKEVLAETRNDHFVVTLPLLTLKSAVR